VPHPIAYGWCFPFISRAGAIASALTTVRPPLRLRNPKRSHIRRPVRVAFFALRGVMLAVLEAGGISPWWVMFGFLALSGRFLVVVVRGGGRG
jgi:hypothetical protein